MNSIKRVAIIVIVFLFLFLLSESFIVENVSDRGILVGIGIDHDGEKYQLTCEMLTGSNPESNEGGFSKLIYGSGDRVSTALQNIYSLTGRQPSLGLCSVIVLGESVYKNLQISDCLTYFSLSDSFRDGSMVVCTVGSAKQALSTASPLNQSPSFAISEVIQKSGRSVTVPKNNLQDFMNSQLTISRGGFLNLVEVVESKISDNLDNQSQGSITQGNFSVKNMAVFSNFYYVDTLTQEQTNGYCLFKEKRTYQGFCVEEDSPIPEDFLPDTATLSAVNKRIKTEVKWENSIPKIDIKIAMKLKRSLTDNNEKMMILMPKDDNKITEKMLKQVEEQGKKAIISVIEKSINSACDYCQISYDLYKEYGSKWKNFVEEYDGFPLDNLQISVQFECRQ